MKRTVWSLICLAIACMSIVLSSCSDGRQDEIVWRQPGNSSYTRGIMSSTEQKNYIEDVAIEVMNMMPASDFEEIMDLGGYIGNTYTKTFYWENVGNWALNIFEKLYEPLNTQSVESETTYASSDYLQRSDYVYTDYKALLLISNFAAHFIARNGRWEIKEAKDLQFIFPDRTGKRCVLKLTTSGQEKRVHALNVINQISSDYKQYGTIYIRTSNYDRTQCTIGIPENITVELLQEGRTIFQSQLHTDINNINDETFDISTGELSVTCNTKLYNNYTFTLSQFNYEGNNSINAAFSSKKNDTSLITVVFASDVESLPSVRVDEFNSLGGNVFVYKNFKFLDKLNPGNVKNAFFKVDIIGKIQICGIVKDIRKYLEFTSDAVLNDDNESSFKRCVAQANTLTDIQLFYDGDDERQASIYLESFYIKRNWTSNWRIEPVIAFDDGSSYAAFSAFFNQDDFSKTISTFKMLTERYANLADTKIKN